MRGGGIVGWYWEVEGKALRESGVCDGNGGSAGE